MPQQLVIVVLVAVGVAAAFLAAWLGRRLWLRRVRRSLVMLFGSKEAVVSAVRSLLELMERLSEADATVWVPFVEDPESDERRAVGEIAHRMDVVSIELATMALPKVLHELADALQAVSEEIRDVTVAVDAATQAQEVLDAVEAVDLAGVTQRLRNAEDTLEGLQGTFKVTDPAVYGGGMYI